MTIEQRLHEGSRAREVLENEAYMAAFSAIKEELTDKWMNSPLRDAEGREKLFQMLTMLRKVQMCLENTMATGKLATEDLKYKRSLAQQAKDFLGMPS